MNCFCKTLFDLSVLKVTSQIIIYIFKSFPNSLESNNNLWVYSSTKVIIFQIIKSTPQNGVNVKYIK